ncbi:YciI family protein [Sinosporangium siamense]|uniref:YCII-related domain-containing protein n=1 Tax=Sinosporangium siamense TaxID=1367973 RepID=A0A919RLQ2_9ACTN|nr:YciI family protein [Sinosporangium siamense]GII95888.1 hypothetical protein Ssi02_61190 [Sinosporangium siamense]
MKYALLAFGDEAEWAEANPEEQAAVYERWGRFERLLNEREAALGGEELAPSGIATTVRKQGDGYVITDGPYAETVEQIGGYVIVEAADLDEAVEFAAACPSTNVEIRPIVER